MSWWTKNRKKVLGLGALAAAPWALPAMGGLLGMAGATGAASAPWVAGALLGEGMIPMAAMGGEGALAASQAMTPLGGMMASGGAALEGMGKVGKGLNAANQVMDFMQGPQQGMPQPMMPQQMQTPNFRSGYAPPMTEEELRKLMQQGGL